MSEMDELEWLREQRRAELLEETNGETDGVTGASESAPAEPVHVDGQAGFEDTIGRYDVVLANFYADWCGPYKMLEPIVTELAAETEAAVAKVDVDTNQRLAQSYRVQGVPTMVLFVDGESVERIVGVHEKAELARLVEQHA